MVSRPNWTKLLLTKNRTPFQLEPKRLLRLKHREGWWLLFHFKWDARRHADIRRMTLREPVDPVDLQAESPNWHRSNQDLPVANVGSLGTLVPAISAESQASRATPAISHHRSAAAFRPCRGTSRRPVAKAVDFKRRRNETSILTRIIPR
eukprot:scaffold7807_cov391-Pinguiococcus_pyrenoidosus.AAC.1